MSGHKAAVASLRLLPVTASKAAHQRPGTGPEAQKTLIWPVRRVTMGISKACALAVGSGGDLVSRCHAVVQLASDGRMWLGDSSTHGTLVLALRSGTAAPGNAISAEEVDALPWASATMLDAGAVVPLATGRRTLLVLGLHRADWLAGAREGMAAELAAKGAALLVYEELRARPAAAALAGTADAEPLAPPPDMLQRFGGATPGRAPVLPPKGRRSGDQRPAVWGGGQAFTIYQLAAELGRKRERDAQRAAAAAAKEGAGNAKNKKWSRFTDGGGATEPGASKQAARRPAVAAGPAAAASVEVSAAKHPTAATSARKPAAPAASSGKENVGGETGSRKSGPQRQRQQQQQQQQRKVLKRMRG